MVTSFTLKSVKSKLRFTGIRRKKIEGKLKKLIKLLEKQLKRPL